MRKNREFVRANREFEIAIQRFPDDVVRKFGRRELGSLLVRFGEIDAERRIPAIVTSRQRFASEVGTSSSPEPSNSLFLKKGFAVPADFGAATLA